VQEQVERFLNKGGISRMLDESIPTVSRHFADSLIEALPAMIANRRQFQDTVPDHALGARASTGESVPDRRGGLASSPGWARARRLRAVAFVEIDLAEHYAALFGALRGQVLIHQDMIEEAEQVDADRAEQGKPPKAEATIARAAALDRLLASAEVQAEALGIDTSSPDDEAQDSDS
jgi:hypothetical protein